MAEGMQAFKAYTDGVADESIFTCSYIKLAVQRHLNNVQKIGHENFPFFFDENKVDLLFSFASALKHSKGQWGGKPIILEPWEVFLLGSIVGWRRVDNDARRFTRAYLEISRKQGKSLLAAVLAAFIFFIDTCGEHSQEILIAATKRQQCDYVFDPLRLMIQGNPTLRKSVRHYKQNNTLLKIADNSIVRTLGRDAGTQDGAMPNVAILDEFHAHPDGSMLEVLESGQGALKSPLIFMITTAGLDSSSFCHEVERKRIIDILESRISTENVFGAIYTLENEQEIYDPSSWVKAAPNLGVSVSEEYYHQQLKNIEDSPSRKNAILTKNFNIWTNARSNWITPEMWSRGAGTVIEDELNGRPCYGGLDLSTTTDLSALVLAFPPQNGESKISLVCRFWMPEANLLQREKTDKVPYSHWVEERFIQSTPGDVIDYDFIESEIRKLASKYSIKEIAYDRWNSTSVVTNLSNENIPFVEFGQGYVSMSPATKNFERLLLSHEINHGNNPVLNWMSGNVTLMSDPAGNVKPVKPDRNKTSVRIDGIISSIMALDRLTNNASKPSSVYEERGLLKIF
ncbi:MAG: terminase large subunit [Spirochaetales bacterium]|nr:terminase large subunit [Spirochaetales bacterium]